MKHIYLNLKRFDVPAHSGGVNRLSSVDGWARAIVAASQESLKRVDPKEAEFIQFFPEAHLLSAVSALDADSPLQIGCQGVYREDVSPGGNFGAFTTNFPAAAAAALGCTAVLIGHCEEREDKKGILREAGISDAAAVNRILNREIRCAVKAHLKVVYCIGETAEELAEAQQVLSGQLRIGLEGIDTEDVTIAYEPIWSIGPGRRSADAAWIAGTASFIKEQTQGLDVVYGGGLKKENAKMLAQIPQIDGGLIALTRFEGEIGFYPVDYLEIIRLYLGKEKEEEDEAFA